MPPGVFPHIIQDAKLKLARLALDREQANEAINWLTRIREVSLPKELRRSLAQLRAQAYVMQGEVLPESLVSDLQASLEKFPDVRSRHSHSRVST